MYNVFVDGQEGTTGLKIHEYLAKRRDVQLVNIDPDKRKDPAVRKACLNKADIAFLCLPDAAAKESATLIENPDTRMIDASTAHRIDPDWVYGLPELSLDQRERITAAKRVSVPGCHATGFTLLLYPLLSGGIIPTEYPVVCTSLTGYSGGGKPLIARYEQDHDIPDRHSPKPYGLKLTHKHLPEIQRICGLYHTPVFMPVVANYYQGMAVSVPLISRFMREPFGAEQVRDHLADYYKDQIFIQVMPLDSDAFLDTGTFLNPEACNGTNRVEIFVFGHQEQILLTARFDNLGKGASGAAVQNMNIMLGLKEDTGLELDNRQSSGAG